MTKKNSVMRRCLCACVVIIMLFAQINVFAKVGNTYVVRAGGLRIHKEASSGSAIIGRLAKGDKVIHKATKNGWWFVKNKSGDLGYVWRSYLRNVTPTFIRNAYYKVYRISKLAVRSGPRSMATRRGTIKRGTTVKLTKKQGNWGYIKLRNGRGGWVPLKYLSYYSR